MPVFLTVFLLSIMWFVHTAQGCEAPGFPFKTYTPDSAAIADQAMTTFVVLTAPRVQSVDIYRATGGSSSLCGTQATFIIKLALPGNAPYTFGDVGFAFRIARGSFPEHALPVEPLMPYDEKSSTLEFVGYWHEGAPVAQKVIDADIAVWLVAPDGSTGPETVFTLFSEPDTPPDEEDKDR
jgi:hypothetical protein